jgi:hypothetical protein
MRRAGQAGVSSRPSGTRGWAGWRPSTVGHAHRPERRGRGGRSSVALARAQEGEGALVEQGVGHARRLATRSRGAMGQAARPASEPHWAGPSSFIFSLSFVLFYSLYHFKSDSLLNACFTNSLIKQNKNILQHDATIKAPLGFYFTRLTHRYKTKITLHYL